VTDDLSTYGLGALPDAPDERDYPLSSLYASEGLTASVVLPATYVAPGMPPILNQGSSPMCVAYSSSAMKAWQDRRDRDLDQMQAWQNRADGAMVLARWALGASLVSLAAVALQVLATVGHAVKGGIP
jgi:hypothetical protein